MWGCTMQLRLLANKDVVFLFIFYPTLDATKLAFSAFGFMRILNIYEKTDIPPDFIANNIILIYSHL